MFNIIELITKGINDGKDMKMMLETLASHVENGKTKTEIFESLYNEIYGNHLCDAFCVELVEHMNHDGESGEIWNIEETNDIARKIGISFSNSVDDYTPYEFWCVFHMMYYDYHNVLRESGINDNAVYGKLADAYLDDEDAPEGKLVNYFFFVMKN